MMQRANRQTIDFLRSIETCTHGLEFMSEEQLDDLPEGVALYIEELEELISRLSCEATAVLFHQGYMPFTAAKGRK